MNDYLTAIAPVLVEVGRTAPRVGKQCQIRNKKNFGKVGRVFWHGKDQFNKATRYCSDAAAHLRECGGRFGYRCGVQLESGEKVFVSAEDVIVTVED